MESVLDTTTAEVRAARSETQMLLLNVAIVGFALSFLLGARISTELPSARQLWVSAFAVYSVFAAGFCFRKLMRILQSIHRRLVWSWLTVALVLSAFSGAAIEVAYRLAVVQALGYGWRALGLTGAAPDVAAVVVVLVVLWLFARILAVLVINSRALR